MPKQPLAEVYGFPIDNFSDKARRCRAYRLCPFGNRVPNCTKDKANDPLGVCSIFDNEEVVITCPIRFRENWIIADAAAEFFFEEDAKWTSLTEVRLNDADGRSAGNIDVVLVSYDDRGKITDFGSLEVQAVYISGNVRRPFEDYIEKQDVGSDFDWTDKPNYPRPDYLSSSRKRLAPQLIYKGGILNSWKKKMAVAVNSGLYKTLPDMEQVSKEKAEMAWMVYDLDYDSLQMTRSLSLKSIIYTEFRSSLLAITQPKPGPVNQFVDCLQTRLDAILDEDSIESSNCSVNDILS